MANVHIKFDKLDVVTPGDTGKVKIRPEYEHVNVNMIFDINMYGKFTRKERLVADVHTTAPSSLIKHSSVVSKEIIGIEFLPASLNDLDIFEYTIGNE